MIYIIVSLILFIVFVLIHVVLHRILIYYGIRTFLSTVVFAAGFFLLWFIIYNIRQNINMYFASNSMNWFTVYIPVSSLLLYGFLATMQIIFFTSPSWGEESPSSKILAIVRKKRKITYKEIKNNFSDKELVLNRISDLVMHGYIKKTQYGYMITPKGKNIARLLNFYKRFISWRSEN